MHPRHPDIVSKAYKVFVCLGGVMLLEVIGIFFESVLFWVLTLLGYALAMVILTFILYHSGEFSLNYRVFYHMYKSTAQLIEHRDAIQSTFFSPRICPRTFLKSCLKF